MDLDNAELRDLPSADAEELKAFVDKRRWFEARLHTLQALPPIYPFVQLHKDDGTSQSDGDWSLPEVATLKAWRNERDRIEQEVFAFDGGDLGRMKAKTREVTLLPLTPPSTQLISITLSTIVLVDKLLSLLRSRGATLELTALRLEWDGLRTSVALELKSLEHVSVELVKAKARWRIVSHERSDVTESGQSRRTSLLDSPLALKIPKSTSGSNLAAAARSVPQSSSSGSLHLPLLHSHIANLKIRLRTLQTTTLARTGTVLDKMIDKAAGLRGLGGLMGPVADQKAVGGAVPDEFLDVQDALDNQASNLEKLITVCETLERQWREASTFASACSSCESLATQLQRRIETAVEESELVDIQSRLDGISVPDLPSLPTPRHPAFADLEQHNSRVSAEISSAAETLQQALRKSSTTLQAQRQLIVARQAISDVSAQSQVLSAELDSLHEFIASSRPDLDSLASLEESANTKKWLSRLPAWRESAEALRIRAVKIDQFCVVSMLRHKQAVSNAFKEERDRNLHAAAESACATLQREVKATMISLDTAERDAAVLLQARAVFAAESRMALELQRLEESLAEAIKAEQWRHDLVQLSDAELSQTGPQALEETMETTIASPLAALPPIDCLVVRHVTVEARRLAEQVRHLTDLGATLSRVKAQRGAMTEVQNEARVLSAAMQDAGDRLFSMLSTGFDAVDDTASAQQLDALDGGVKKLRTQVESFTESLPSRVSFVSADHSNLTLLDPSTLASEAPMTPPLTPSQATLPELRDQRTEGLSDLDKRVRRAANDLASELAAAVSRVESRLGDSREALQDSRSRRTLRIWTELGDRMAESERFYSQRLREVTESLTATTAADLEVLHDEVRNDVEIFKAKADDEICWPVDQSRCGGLTGASATLTTASLSARERIATALESLQHLQIGIERALSSCSSTDSNVAVNGRSRTQEDSPGALTDATASLIPSQQADSHAIVAPSTSASQTRARSPSPSTIPASPRQAAMQTNVTPPAMAYKAHNSSRASGRRSAATPGRSSIPLHVRRPAPSHSDVFGPDLTPPLLASPPGPPIDHRQLSREINTLRGKLDDIDLDGVVYPSSSTLKKTPRLRRLPTPARAVELKKLLMSVSEATDDLVVPDSHAKYDEYLSLFNAVKARVSLLPQLDHLVVFSTAVEKCDAALSQLLEHADAPKSGDDGQAAWKARETARATVERMEETALMVESDNRVGLEQERVRQAWKELQSVIDDSLHLDGSDGGESIATTRSIPSVKRIPFPSRLPNSKSSRTVSNPLSASVTASTEASRSRAVSERSSMPNVNPARFRKDPVTLSTIPGTPIRQRVESTSSIPRPVRSVMASPAPPASPLAAMRPLPKVTGTPKGKSLTLPRSRSKSGLDALSRPRVSSEDGLQPYAASKLYISNPKNRLDIAVGRIVNKLEVDIPIAPAGLDWQDESGKYWIGAEGRAKLCFCRILRSRCVMVRIGGGWQELSRYLLDHFADDMIQLPAAMVSVAEKELLPSTPAPPGRHPPGPATPAAASGLQASPTKTPSGADGSPLSLVAMQLIRKASESPPVRERERERMWSPRKSLLG